LERPVIETIDATVVSREVVVDAVTRVIEAGGLVIFPTDTVYGIGCDPRRLSAVERIFEVKGRPAHKALSLHLATVTEALEYCGHEAGARTAVARLLPGAVTVIVRRPRFIDPRVVGGGETMGLRVPADDLCAAICESAGPLAATSANRSGMPAYRGEEGAESLPLADLFVYGGATRLKGESTVINVLGGRPRIVRDGVVSPQRLEAALGAVDRSNGAGGTS